MLESTHRELREDAADPFAAAQQTGSKRRGGRGSSPVAPVEEHLQNG
jgi:hypothetical protein